MSFSPCCCLFQSQSPRVGPSYFFAPPRPTSGFSSAASNAFHAAQATVWNSILKVQRTDWRRAFTVAGFDVLCRMGMASSDCLPVSWMTTVIDSPEILHSPRAFPSSHPGTPSSASSPRARASSSSHPFSFSESPQHPTRAISSSPIANSSPLSPSPTPIHGVLSSQMTALNFNVNAAVGPNTQHLLVRALSQACSSWANFSFGPPTPFFFIKFLPSSPLLSARMSHNSRVSLRFAPKLLSFLACVSSCLFLQHFYIVPFFFFCFLLLLLLLLFFLFLFQACALCTCFLFLDLLLSFLLSASNQLADSLIVYLAAGVLLLTACDSAHPSGSSALLINIPFPLLLPFLSC